jgi:hypothetical protein
VCCLAECRFGTPARQRVGWLGLIEAQSASDSCEAPANRAYGADLVNAPDWSSMSTICIEMVAEPPSGPIIGI